MSNTFLVMAGGAIGAASRFHIGRLIGPFAGSGWPVATLAINLVGGLAMGLLAGAMLRGGLADGWRLFVGVGLLGGFTTFSAFSMEMVQLLQDGRWADGIGYAVVSVIGSVALLAAGLWMVRTL
jgi:fluoride exporter